LAHPVNAEAGRVDDKSLAAYIGTAIGAFVTGGLAILGIKAKQKTPDATALELRKLESHDIDVAGVRSDLAAMRAEVIALRTELDKVRTDNFDLQKSMIRQESEFNRKIALFDNAAKIDRDRYEKQIDVLTGELLTARSTIVRLQAEKDSLQVELNASAAAGSLERRQGAAPKTRLQEVIVVNKDPIKVKSNDDVAD